MSVGCVKVVNIEESVRSVQGNKSKLAKIKLTALDSGRPFPETEIDIPIDSGVSKTLISESCWRKVRQRKGDLVMRLKKSKVKFSPF